MPISMEKTDDGGYIIIVDTNEKELTLVIHEDNPMMFFAVGPKDGTVIHSGTANSAREFFDLFTKLLE